MFSEEEKQRRRFIRQELKKKNLALFYKEFGVNHRAWLKELTDKYKERGKYPLSPLVLSDYYEDYGDKLLATLIACLLLDDNNRVMQQVMGVKKLLGQRPYEELYLNRAFVQLSNGINQTKNIAYFSSTRYWQIARLFDIIWEIEHSHNKPIFNVFFDLITINEYTPFHAMQILFDELPVKKPDWRINMALIRLCDCDGIGEHIWDIGGLRQKLMCPYNKNIKMFLANWIPCWNRLFSLKEVSILLGFEKEIDIYYCFLAFKELALYNPKQISEFLYTYSVQFKNRTLGKNGKRLLKEKLPPIRFD